MEQRSYVRTGLLISAIFALVTSVASCAQSNSGAAIIDGASMTGTITISGAWALYPMMVQWGEEFQKQYPDVRFDISAGGAGKGMADALSDAVDIGMVSREVYPEEVERGAFWVAVTKDAVFPTISAGNPVWDQIQQAGLSHKTLVGIYVSGEITTWGQAVGRPEVTDLIHVYTRSDACGAAETWAAYLGGHQEDLLGIAVYGDPGLLDTVIKDPLAIGFNNLNYAFDMGTGQPVVGAQVAPIDLNGNGVVDGEELYETKAQAVMAVGTGLYPSPPARDLNLVTHGQPTGLPKAFLAWILVDGQVFVDKAGYIELPPDKLEQELRKLD